MGYILCLLVNLLGSLIFFIFISNELELVGAQTLTNSLSLVITTIVSVVYLKEPIEIKKIMGMILILLGFAIYK